jgi:hypothetical protein
MLFSLMPPLPRRHRLFLNPQATLRLPGSTLWVCRWKSVARCFCSILRAMPLVVAARPLSLPLLLIAAILSLSSVTQSACVVNHQQAFLAPTVSSDSPSWYTNSIRLETPQLTAVVRSPLLRSFVAPVAALFPSLHAQYSEPVCFARAGLLCPLVLSHTLLVRTEGVGL